MSCSISPEIGEQILKAYLTEDPRPSAASLATRHGLTARSVQRYIKRHQDAVSQVSHKGVKAELVVSALPQAMADVKAITKELPRTKMRKVLAEAEEQYIRYKEEDPALAGNYLELMRKTVIEMARWLGLDKGISLQDNEVHITVNWEGPRNGC